MSCLVLSQNSIQGTRRNLIPGNWQGCFRRHTPGSQRLYILCRYMTAYSQAPPVMNLADFCRSRNQLLLLTYRFQHLAQLVTDLMHKVAKRFAIRNAAGKQIFMKELELMDQISHLIDHRHACPPFERMQTTQQAFHMSGAVRLRQPPMQMLSHLLSYFKSYFEENINQFVPTTI